MRSTTVHQRLEKDSMTSHSTRTVIYAALAGNMLIAISKFGAAWFTGSSAMLSEAIHSLVDTGNQGLLLHGIRQAAKPATSEHPFGHGLQLYFWTFIVAILIFGLGAGVAMLEGIQKILNPHPLESPWVNYSVLALSLMFEGITWLVALRAFHAGKGRRRWLDAAEFVPRLAYSISVTEVVPLNWSWSLVGWTEAYGAFCWACSIQIGGDAAIVLMGQKLLNDPHNLGRGIRL